MQILDEMDWLLDEYCDFIEKWRTIHNYEQILNDALKGDTLAIDYVCMGSDHYFPV